MTAVVSITGCDDSADQLNPIGSSGTPSQNDLAQGVQIGSTVTGAQPITDATGVSGFGSPQDISQLGSVSYVTDSAAKIDTDGDPTEQGFDPNWQPGTSGQINGSPVNSAQYAFIVMSSQQMANSGVQLGDWALVTNDATGQSVWARVEDRGPATGTGEISEAAATAIGIQFQKNSWTIGNPTVTVQAYAGTAWIPGGGG